MTKSKQVNSQSLVHKKLLVGYEAAWRTQMYIVYLDITQTNVVFLYYVFEGQHIEVKAL